MLRRINYECKKYTYTAKKIKEKYRACLLYVSYLKVVGNEKVGGSGRWQMIRIYLGPW